MILHDLIETPPWNPLYPGIHHSGISQKIYWASVHPMDVFQEIFNKNLSIN